MIIDGDKYEVILNRKTLKERIKALAKKITTDYRGGPPPILLIVINGSMNFGVRLSEELQSAGLNHMTESVRIKRYHGENQAGDIKIISEPCIDLSGREIIVIEDLVDEGKTLNFLNKFLENQKPKEIQYCVLAVKKDHQPLDFEIKYKVIEEDLGPAWLAGFGMDSNQQYRGLKEIWARV